MAARASSTAFSRFNEGLAAEVETRMAALGSTMAALGSTMAALGSTMAAGVGALEMERERIPPTRTASSLQQVQQ